MRVCSKALSKIVSRTFYGALQGLQGRYAMTSRDIGLLREASSVVSQARSKSRARAAPEEFQSSFIGGLREG